MMVPTHKFKNIYGCPHELDIVGMDIITRNAEAEGSQVQGPFGLHSMFKICLGNNLYSLSNWEIKMGWGNSSWFNALVLWVKLWFFSWHNHIRKTNKRMRMIKQGKAESVRGIICNHLIIHSYKYIAIYYTFSLCAAYYFWFYTDYFNIS